MEAFSEYIVHYFARCSVFGFFVCFVTCCRTYVHRKQGVKNRRETFAEIETFIIPDCIKTCQSDEIGKHVGLKHRWLTP